MSSQDAWEIWQQSFSYLDKKVRPDDSAADADESFVQYIREKIHLLKRRQASGKVENSTGFLLQAIRQNYANPEFAQEQKREASAATQQAKRERLKQVKILEQQKVELEKACDRELNQLRDHVAAESPDILDRAVAELLTENRGFLFLYN